MKYNILTKNLTGKEFIITDMIVTALSKKEVERLQQCNDCLKGFRFVANKDTEFHWWQHATKYLTKHHLYMDQLFDCDFYGNVKRYN